MKHRSKGFRGNAYVPREMEDIIAGWEFNGLMNERIASALRALLAEEKLHPEDVKVRYEPVMNGFKFEVSICKVNGE